MTGNAGARTMSKGATSGAAWIGAIPIAKQKTIEALFVNRMVREDCWL